MKLLVALMLLSATAALGAENLVVNGTFDDPKGPLTGWNVDYAWSRNVHYVGNVSRIRPMASHAGQRNVVQIMPHGEVGSKMESVLIPFEQGDRYRATLRVKGGRYRIYFSGYQWRPGIRPHSNPTLPEMRQAYRSRAVDGQSANWETISLEIPGVESSELSMRHLRRVRFITLYIFFLGEGYVNDVQVVKVN